MRVEPGRLLERECPHCGGVERRCFGEVESERGELASYAFGWTSGHEDKVAHMTIGLGAGNPGGGSFHIEVGIGPDGNPGMRFVDRPFEDVPEGGPDLTREQALAHDCADFVWFVADNVVAQDRRAWWMEAWLRGTGAFVTVPAAEGREPVRHVIHDVDGTWQLLCGTPGAENHAQLWHLFHFIDRDPTLIDVLDLEPGERADRKRPGKRWKRARVRTETA